MPARLERAVRDLIDGTRAYPIWGRLGWQDIRQRYRRSLLGPFWITISAAARFAPRNLRTFSAVASTRKRVVFLVIATPI